MSAPAEVRDHVCEVCIERGARPLADAVKLGKLYGDTHRPPICESAECAKWLRQYNARQRGWARQRGSK